MSSRRRHTHALALGLGVIAAAATSASCGDGRDIVVGSDYETVLDPLPEAINKVDVLVVVDTSGSIEAERDAVIAAAGQNLFGQLTDDLGYLPDLHVAVVSTDVYPGIDGVPGCAAGSTGDGRFRTGNGTVTCPVQGAYISDAPDGNGGRIDNYDGTIADAFSCMATLDTNGCGFEQPLEAMRRALDGRYTEHAGFLRPDALLVVLFLTDEDDCSAFDPTIFSDPTAGPESPLGPRTSFRCFEFGVVCDPDEPRAPGTKSDCAPREDSPYITPIAEYRAFLESLKADPNLVMISGLMGPADTVVVGPDPIDPNLTALIPSCSIQGTQYGTTPPIRLTSLGESFPSRFFFENICTAGPSSERLRRVTRATSGVMSRRPCLLGNIDSNLTTERCRAYDVIGTTRNRIDSCDATNSSTNCFYVEPSFLCDYTLHSMAARYLGTLAPGHRLVVECLAD